MTPIARQINGLKNLSFTDLKALWLEYFPDKATPTKPHFIKRAVAYRIQELAYDGIAPSAEEKLNCLIAETSGKKQRKIRPAAIPIAGTRLIREWHGRRYEVIILPKGFEFEGREWRSLTSIARHITGTRWNGPLFFGLRKNKKEST